MHPVKGFFKLMSTVVTVKQCQDIDTDTRVQSLSCGIEVCLQNFLSIELSSAES